MGEAINLEQRIFICVDGLIHPVVSIFDSDGVDCSPKDAVSAVAGSEGRWFAIDLSEFGAGAFQ